MNAHKATNEVTGWQILGASLALAVAVWLLVWLSFGAHR